MPTRAKPKRAKVNHEKHKKRCHKESAIMESRTKTETDSSQCSEGIEIIDIEILSNEELGDDDLMDITEEVKARTEKKNGRKAIYHTREGKLLFKNKNYELAKRQFKRSIEYGSLNYVNYLLKSHAEYELDNLEEACSDAREAIKLATRNGQEIAYNCQIWLLKIKVAMDEVGFCKRQIEEIKKNFESVIAQDFIELENNFNKLADYNALLNDEKNPEEIIRICLGAIKLAPKSPHLFLMLAMGYIKTEKYLEARSACVLALKYERDCVYAKYYQFQSFYLSNCFTEAKNIVRDVLERKIYGNYETLFKVLFEGMKALENERSNMKLHVTLVNYKLLRESVFNIQKITSSVSGLKNYMLEAELFLTLSVICKETRDNKGAMNYCMKAIEINEKCSEAYHMKGDLEMEQEKFSDAFKSYKMSFELDQLDLNVKAKMSNVAHLNMLPNYYEVMGVKTSATSRTLRTAYKELAKTYHPDKNPGASEDEFKEYSKKFTEISEAYNVLNDPFMRCLYDSSRSPFLKPVGEPLQLSKLLFGHSIRL